MTDEKRLVKRAQRGDTAAFEELVTAHEARIYSLCLRMTGNREDAYDLTQESFLKIWRKLDSFNQDASFGTWAYRLASNTCIDFLRKEKKRRDVPLFSEDDDGEETQLLLPDQRYDPEAIVQQRDLQASLEAALESLEPQYRQILTLRELCGLSYSEIGSQLQLKEGTVKSRLARAREQVRKFISSSGNFSKKSSSKKEKGVTSRG